MPTIKLLKRAELELTEACSWYEKQQKGLSLRLRKAVKDSLDNIASNPGGYAKRYNTDMHFAPLHKFPYIIVYWFDVNLKTLL